MFKKLLKYDLLSVWKIWWILSIIGIGAAFAGSFILRLVITDGFRHSFLCSLGILVAVLCYVAIFAFLVIACLLVYLRFYRNFFTDEGYLTFTLPISRRKLLAVKMVNCMFWALADLLFLLLCGVIAALIIPPSTAAYPLINPVVFTTLGKGIAEIYQTIGFGWFALYTLIGIVGTAVLWFFSTSLIYLCIVIGSVIAKKLKLLAAIGVYYGVSMVVSLLFQIVGTLGITSMISGIAYYLSSADYGTNRIYGLIAVLALLAVSVIGVFGLALYNAMLHQCERKLNLP